MLRKLFFCLPLLVLSISLHSQEHSVAREWNEELLEAIRNDFARPTVHARNLFHTSVLMYDAWAIFDDTAQTIFLGRSFGGFEVPFDGITTPNDLDAATEEIINYAIFRLLNHRFAQSPGADETLLSIQAKFEELGNNPNFTSIDYSNGSYAALGNYLGQQMIAFGLQDGANEANGYENEFYQPNNEPLILELYEDNTNINPNIWQPLAFDVFIDQSGNPIPNAVPEFLSPEWGQVTSFALDENNLDIFEIDGFDYLVYNDPGEPSFIEDSNGNSLEDPYKWGFSLVTSWSQHLDPNDNVMIDISPASIGNIQSYPATFEEYQEFYDFENGGDASIGHSVNPFTGSPYPTQMVPRGDYARVLAEFWADGPDSETPPGHWFTIFNYVSDHPELEKRLGGEGDILSDLEWDIKLYLLLGAAMHDSAINTWGIKGYYDYIRPISALRYMAGKGQSTDTTASNFDPHGLPLIPGLIETVEVGDPLAGDMDEFVGELKVNTRKGPDYIADPTSEIAGVDWILAERWWPYQRPTFVTPPFAGYISGHSTFSSAAAQILALATGDPFFPGGVGVFDVPQNDFLVFEQGPSVDMQLQWATYKDASDQTSLSRIWGGIHPPIDDIPGRLLGTNIGTDAFTKGVAYFDGTLSVNENTISSSVYPNPFAETLTFSADSNISKIDILSLDGRLIHSFQLENQDTNVTITAEQLSTGMYFMKLFDSSLKVIGTHKVIKQ
jgi:hypothetical protein